MLDHLYPLPFVFLNLNVGIALPQIPVVKKYKIPCPNRVIYVKLYSFFLYIITNEKNV